MHLGCDRRHSDPSKSPRRSASIKAGLVRQLQLGFQVRQVPEGETLPKALGSKGGGSERLGVAVGDTTWVNPIFGLALGTQGNTLWSTTAWELQPLPIRRNSVFPIIDSSLKANDAFHRRTTHIRSRQEMLASYLSHNSNLALSESTQCLQPCTEKEMGARVCPSPFIYCGELVASSLDATKGCGSCLKTEALKCALLLTSP